MIEDILPSGGTWGGVALILSLILGPLAILSRESAEKFWLIGRLVRWVRGRKQREIEETSTLADMTLKAHQDDRARWAVQLKEVRQEMCDERKRFRREMEADRERFRAEMDDMEKKVDSYWAYIVFAADFSRQLSILAAKHGWEPPPPKLMLFSEWSRTHRS